MKKVIKILVYILALIVVAIIVLVTYVKLALPNVGKPEQISIERTPERIARGKYLANSVTVCKARNDTKLESVFELLSFDILYYLNNIIIIGINTNLFLSVFV